MTPNDVRAEAMRVFGDVDTVREELVRVTRLRQGRHRRAECATDLAYDARYATRGMRHANPAAGEITTCGTVA